MKQTDILDQLSKVHGILVPGGFGDRGIQGKIASIKFAIGPAATIKDL